LSVATVTRGIVVVGTASHGGIWLSPERVERLPEVLRSKTLPWFEEDCDAALVILAFAEHFSTEQLKFAFLSAFQYGNAALKSFLARHYVECRDNAPVVSPPELPKGYELFSFHDGVRTVYGFRDDRGTGYSHDKWDEDDSVVTAWAHFTAEGSS